VDVKIIRSEAEYQAALHRLSELMDSDTEPGGGDENTLELLALVIQKYEKENTPLLRPDPIEAILFRMDQMGLSRKDMIPFLGSASKVSEVLSRKRPLSLAMIRRLHEGLGIPLDLLVMDFPRAEQTALLKRREEGLGSRIGA